MDDSPSFPPDMDYRFLQFIESSIESQEHIQRFYLPFFADCHTVVDLGCGMGGFAGLLVNQGIHAIGVDLDSDAVTSVSRLGAEGVQADALDYLAGLDENSIDGIFSGHLVEHMPCETAFELILQAYRVLRPEGRLVLTTPNVRGLFAHLELFYMHFDHERFYHPNLLCFFMQQAGFKDWEWGENPELNQLLLGDLWPMLGSPSANMDDPLKKLSFDDLFKTLQAVGSTPEKPGYTDTMYGSQPEQGVAWWRRLIRPIRTAMVKWLVKPEFDRMKLYVDWLRVYADWLKMSTDSTRNLLRASLERLDRSFECYATAVK